MTPTTFKKLQKKLTNKEAAKSLGVSLSIIEKWRSGTTTIKQVRSEWIRKRWG